MVYVVVGIVVVVVTVVGAIVVAIEGADVVVGDVLDQPQVTNHVCFTFAARKMKDGQVLTNFPQTSQCFSSLGKLKKVQDFRCPLQLKYCSLGKKEKENGVSLNEKEISITLKFKVMQSS